MGSVRGKKKNLPRKLAVRTMEVGPILGEDRRTEKEEKESRFEGVGRNYASAGKRKEKTVRAFQISPDTKKRQKGERASVT